MSSFRCTQCSHLVHIATYPGHEQSDLKHSFCGGALEHVNREKIAPGRYRRDHLNRPVFKTKSGRYVLNNNLFVKAPEPLNEEK